VAIISQPKLPHSRYSVASAQIERVTMKKNYRNIAKAYAALLVLSLAGGLSACTGPAPYGPKLEGGTTGYTDERLGQNRFRVTYAGTAATPRTTVEDYLLYRAAQVTLAAGYAGFEFDTRDTKARTTYYSSFDEFPEWPGFHHGFGWYWHSWPYDDLDVQTRPVTRYEAYAEIVMLNPDQTKSEPRALDAHDVIAHLGPKVEPMPSAR
jgi:hypothetical protein